MTLSSTGAPAAENPPVPPDTEQGDGEREPGYDDRPDRSEDAPGTDEGSPESPAEEETEPQR